MYEIHGCKPEVNGDGNIIRVPDQEAEFFTLYEVKEGESQAIKDFTSREEAEKYLASKQNILPVENHLQLGFLVADWHRNVCHHLMAVIEAPADIDLNVQFEGADQPELITDPRERALFKLGVEYALSQFLKLPFTMEEDPNETQTTGDGSEL